MDIGCIVGGSSAVNGKIFQRGISKDYDIWGELGGDGVKSTWSWSDLLPYFKRSRSSYPQRLKVTCYLLTSISGNSAYATEARDP